MEAKLSQRKRKESPNPLVGTLTRSKSQIYSHLNRSGRHRTDAPTAQINASLPKDARDATLSPKDLRSRRVFSEPLILGEDQHKNPGLFGSVEQVECEVNPNSQIDCIGGEVCGENPNLSRPMGVCFEDKRLGVDSFCDAQRLGDFSPTMSNRNQLIDEENVQTTPPDPDIFASQKDAEYRLNGGNDALHTGDCYTRMQSNCTPNRKIDSIQRRKLVLNPCRLKVFSSPSSVSYRRLLPYLLDIAKEKSSAKESNSCSVIETVVEEKASVQSQVPMAQDSHVTLSGFGNKTLKPMLHTVSGDSSIHEKSPSNMQAGNSDDQVPSRPTSIDCSSDTTWPTRVTADRQNEMLSLSTPRRDLSHVYKVSSAKRLKVFKTPSSVSYRKLLPYLMDVAKEKSCALEIKSCPKIDTVLEENPTVSSQVPLANASCVKTSDFEDNTIKSALPIASQEMSEVESSEKIQSSLQAGDTTNHFPNNASATDCPDNTSPSVVSTNIENGMSIPSNFPRGDLSDVDQLLLSESGEINIIPVAVPNPTVCLTDSTSKVLHNCNDADHTTNIMTAEDAITVYQNTSPVKALPCSESYTVNTAKGILKRNPRGCRGLCTCLSCASFRLHAERAFEFSRNQLQDTEEVVLELIKELSHLRSVLQMPFEDSNSQATSKFEEVCASASKAEEIARTRLKEMNQELFVHCRMKCLQRPRVNFAIKIEDKGCKREKPV